MVAEDLCRYRCTSASWSITYEAEHQLVAALTFVYAMAKPEPFTVEWLDSEDDEAAAADFWFFTSRGEEAHVSAPEAEVLLWSNPRTNPVAHHSERGL
jgi:hypothetical protein